MNLLNILKRSPTKGQASWVLVPCFLIMLIFWAIARVLYASSGAWYVVTRNSISSHGNLEANPIGGWFFIVGTVIGSLGIALLMLFIHQRIRRRTRWLAMLFLLAGLIGAFGLFLVGITPQGSGRAVMRVHSLGEGFAFLGLGGAAFLSFILGVVRVIQGERWPTLPQFLVLSALVIQLGSMVFFANSGSVRQWTAFNAILAWLTGLFLIAPSDISSP